MAHFTFTSPIILTTGDWSCAHCIMQGVRGHKKHSKAHKTAAAAVRHMGRLRSHNDKQNGAEEEEDDDDAPSESENNNDDNNGDDEKSSLESSKVTERAASSSSSSSNVEKPAGEDSKTQNANDNTNESGKKVAEETVEKGKGEEEEEEDEEEAKEGEEDGDKKPAAKTDTTAATGGGVGMSRKNLALFKIADSLSPAMKINGDGGGGGGGEAGSPVVRARRRRVQPSLYTPQRGADSHWLSDEKHQWLTEPAKDSDSSSNSSSSSEDEEGQGETKDQKRKKPKSGDDKDKKKAPAFFCNFCKDDSSIPVCCFCACRQCFGKHDKSKLLLCDRCNDEYHTYCLDPPLSTVPTSKKWFCPSCEPSANPKTGLSVSTRRSTGSNNNVSPTGTKEVTPVASSSALGTRGSAKKENATSPAAAAAAAAELAAKSASKSPKASSKSPRQRGRPPKNSKSPPPPPPTPPPSLSPPLRKRGRPPKDHTLPPPPPPSPPPPRKRGRPPKSASQSPPSLSTKKKQRSASASKVAKGKSTSKSPEKRGRGRPPALSSPPPRKRGRPPKNASQSPPAARPASKAAKVKSTSSSKSPEKRGRGRPPVKKTDNEATPDKRGRGRPPVSKSDFEPPLKKTKIDPGRKGGKSSGSVVLEEGVPGLAGARFKRYKDEGEANEEPANKSPSYQQSVKSDDAASEAELMEYRTVKQSRSGRIVKRSSFHDEIDEGEQHLKSVRYQQELQRKADETDEVPWQAESETGNFMESPTFSEKEYVETFAHVPPLEPMVESIEPSPQATAPSIELSKPWTDESIVAAPKIDSRLPEVTTNLNPVVAMPLVVQPVITASYAQPSVSVSASSVAAAAAAADHLAGASYEDTGVGSSKVPRRKPGARECMQISRRFGVRVIPQRYMDTLLDYCTRGKVEHLIRMRERLDEHSNFLESQLAGLEAAVRERGELDIVVPALPERAADKPPAGTL
jgi:hypothetical protein